MPTASVAVLVFDGVEPLDFCGPFEVFTSAKAADGGPPPFNVFTCAESTSRITTIGGLSLNPRYALLDCPAPDILVVPGGYGTREQLTNTRLLEWLKSTTPRCDIVLSVCTGALLLAKAGLLKGVSATTHHEAIDLLRVMAPDTEIRRFERFVDNGQLVIAAGMSAGIDAALHVVRRRLAPEIARATAEYMEYDWKPTKSAHAT